MDEKANQAEFYKSPEKFDNYMGAFQYLKWQMLKETDLTYNYDIM